MRYESKWNQKITKKILKKGIEKLGLVIWVTMTIMIVEIHENKFKLYVGLAFWFIGAFLFVGSDCLTKIWWKK
jgi:uncharacterized membrane protein YgdD (TMEM256/DUF423 family)